MGDNLALLRALQLRIETLEQQLKETTANFELAGTQANLLLSICKNHSKDAIEYHDKIPNKLASEIMNFVCQWKAVTMIRYADLLHDNEDKMLDIYKGYVDKVSDELTACFKQS